MEFIKERIAGRSGHNKFDQVINEVKKLLHLLTLSKRVSSIHYMRVI